ncbi:MAG: hypothetical protein R3302_05585 [Sulfurimonadaceae bacterium]|nr:hypothetical protein [Sulfurimonadaceae bacterium]
MSFSKWLVGSASAIVAAYIMTGCAPQQTIDPLVEQQKPGPLYAHELRQIMNELNNVVYEQDERSELERVADTIKKFSHAIASAPSRHAGLKLTDVEEKEFFSYGQELRRQGNEIQAIAENYEMEKLQGALNNMVGICNRCHVRFRDARQ